MKSSWMSPKLNRRHSFKKWEMKKYSDGRKVHMKIEEEIRLMHPQTNYCGQNSKEPRSDISP